MKNNTANTTNIKRISETREINQRVGLHTIGNSFLMQKI
jgi:hypothetical protein